MTVVQLASVVTSEISFINMWLVGLTLICTIGAGYIVYKTSKQQDQITMLQYELRKLSRK